MFTNEVVLCSSNGRSSHFYPQTCYRLSGCRLSLAIIENCRLKRNEVTPSPLIFFFFLAPDYHWNKPVREVGDLQRCVLKWAINVNQVGCLN